jgi:hypothetical protein
MPAGIGAVLIARDVVLRFISALQPKHVESDNLTYGNEAKAEAKPIRTSLFAKCWEGPYCREFVRVHCPIFIKRAACWREKSGCYCEEEIVSQAASKVQGVHLEMVPSGASAPTPPPPSSPAATPPVVTPTRPVGLSSVGSPPINRGLGHDPLSPPPSAGRGGSVGLSGVGSSGVVHIQIGNEQPAAVVTGNRKVELNAAQKRERCRNCVIYNEHQREKYKILLPLTFIGGIALCALFSTPARGLIGTGMIGLETLLARITFNSGPAPKIAQPSDGAVWTLIGALSLMFLSKLLQVLEWACFKVKI